MLINKTKANLVRTIMHGVERLLDELQPGLGFEFDQATSILMDDLAKYSVELDWEPDITLDCHRSKYMGYEIRISGWQSSYTCTVVDKNGKEITSEYNAHSFSEAERRLLLLVKGL